MAKKLPENLVKRPPVFDNPLRPTSATLALVDSAPEASLAEEGASVLSTGAPSAPMSSDAESPDTIDPLIYRSTVRLTHNQWKALQTEAYARRMKGEKINPAELIRVLVDEWMARRST